MLDFEIQENADVFFSPHCVCHLKCCKFKFIVICKCLAQNNHIKIPTNFTHTNHNSILALLNAENVFINFPIKENINTM